jgi:autophagy-related protein 11
MRLFASILSLSPLPAVLTFTFSLEVFRNWVAAQADIPQTEQIILTGQGKAVRSQTLLTQSEIFVYDGRHVQSDASIPQIPDLPKYEIERPPDTIQDQNDMESWVALFKARRAWALQIVEDCRNMSNLTQQRFDEITVFIRAFDAAIVSLHSKVRLFDQRGSESYPWATDILNHKDVLKAEWRSSLDQLRTLPTTTSHIRFLLGHDTPRNKRKATLEDLVDSEEVEQAAGVLEHFSKRFNTQYNDTFNGLDELVQATEAALNGVSKGEPKAALETRRESIQLMADIEAVARKINTDYENVLGLSSGDSDLVSTSKLALLHTKNFLPSLMRRSDEMDGIARKSVEMRNIASLDFLRGMQTISKLTTDANNVEAKLKALEIAKSDAEALELLDLVRQLPVAYSAFLAEAIRRREWAERVKTDSSTLANEMALFQKEEETRRRKWQESTGLLFWPDRVERQAMGIEINIHGEEESWPQVTRKDLDDFLAAMQAQGVKDEAVSEVSKIINDLNNPTRQQSKRAKAFKAGSIHEAAIGRSALLVRGDSDLIRTLSDEKSKIEVKLKSSESRVRRLEDLLHRQGHASATGNLFQPLSSPSPEIGNSTQTPEFLMVSSPS